jgi:MoaA/NifB/PqqE/SkfB family radical SAM enzyme
MNYNTLKLPFSVLLSRVGVKSPLRVLHFITFRCNLHCKYCGLWRTPRKEMSTEQIKKAMDEFANAGTLFWTFTGGEPLLRKDIGELADYAKKLFSIVTITTNGILLKKRIDEIKNVNYLTVSIDGPKEVTDFNRGEGTFDKAVEGIKTARKRNIDVVINAVISKANTKNNFEGIKKLIEIALELDCKLTFSVVYSDQFNKKYVKKLFPSKKELKNAFKIIEDTKKSKPGFIMFSDPCIDMLENPRKQESCLTGKLFCDLLPDGTVAPCYFKEELGVDGLKYGFVEAFKMLPEIKNCLCVNTCYIELNCILSLNPASVKENLLKYITFIGR